jgi:hypothetical protein
MKNNEKKDYEKEKSKCLWRATSNLVVVLHGDNASVKLEHFFARHSHRRAGCHCHHGLANRLQKHKEEEEKKEGEEKSKIGRLEEEGERGELEARLASLILFLPKQISLSSFFWEGKEAGSANLSLIFITLILFFPFHGWTDCFAEAENVVHHHRVKEAERAKHEREGSRGCASGMSAR